MEQKSYYDASFKPIRNKLCKFRPLDIAEHAVNKLAKNWKEISINSHVYPWLIFNIIIWGVNFGDKNSKVRMSENDFEKLYDSVVKLPDEESVIEGFGKSYSLFWLLRSIIHQQLLYQINGIYRWISIGFALELSKKLDNNVSNFLRFVSLISIITEIDFQKKQCDKSLFKNILKQEEVDSYWEIFDLTEEKLHQYALESKERFKTVLFERNSLTVFRKHPFFINNYGNLQILNLQLFKIFMRNGIYELMLDRNMICKKKIEDEFERILSDYTKMFDTRFEKPKQGVDGVIQDEDNDIDFFVEFKSSIFHQLLPQYPTQDAHFSSLKSSILKGYSQMLKSFRNFSSRKNKSCGMIVTLHDITLCDPLENWKHSIEEWLRVEKLNEQEIEFIEKYVWIVNYSEYIQILHSSKEVKCIYLEMEKAVSDKATGKGSFSLAWHFYAKPTVPDDIFDIKIFGDNINEFIKDNLTKDYHSFI